MRKLIAVVASLCLPVLADNRPEDAALAYARKIQAGTVDLRPGADTAISSTTSKAKTESIAKSHLRLSESLRECRLEVGPVLIESDLAGVLIRATGNLRFSKYHVLPVALVMRDGTWQAAPLPASFENTTITHWKSYRQPIQRVETWLIRENVREIEQLRASTAQRIRQQLSRVISPKSLASWSATQVAERYLKACREQDFATIQALSGGISDHLPDYWSDLAEELHTAMADIDESSDLWYLLLNPDNLHFVVKQEALSPRDRLIGILSIDPSRPFEEAFEYLRLRVTNEESSGQWAVAPPLLEKSRRIQAEILASFPERFLKISPSKPCSTARELADRILGSISSRDQSDWQHRLFTGEDRKILPQSCYRAAAILSRTNHPNLPVVAFELDLKESRDHALLAIQWLPMGSMAFAPDVLHLRKAPSGWLWETSPDHQQREIADQWLRERREDWNKTYLARAIASCPTPDFERGAPAMDASLGTVQAWIASAADGNWRGAMEHCARLGAPHSSRFFFRNLAADGKHMILHRNKLSVHPGVRGRYLSLVTARVADAPDSNDLLLVVASTTEGPKILQEIDMGDPARRGRAFLNRESIDRLAEVHENAAKELKSLIGEIFKHTP